MFIPGEDELDDLNASLLHGLLKVHIIEAKVSQKPVGLNTVTLLKACSKGTPYRSMGEGCFGTGST